MEPAPFLGTIFGVRLRQKGNKHVCLDPGKHMREERRREWELGSFGWGGEHCRAPILVKGYKLPTTPLSEVRI